MAKQIPLTKGLFATVDDDDYPIVCQHKWYAHVSSGGYVTAARREHGSRRLVLMHRYLVSVPCGFIVDHADGDTLNNQKSNLRICTHSENNMNKVLQRNNTSGIRGVHWHSRFNRWQATIKINRKSKHLGYFDAAEEAEAAHRIAEDQLFGEYSLRNSRPNPPRS